MKQIDFLPKYYHEQAAKRKTKVWRWAVVFLFGSSVALTAIVQYAMKLETRKYSTQIDAMFAETQARRQECEQLKIEYAEVQQDAELHTYLKSNWPRTQLLSQIVSALSPTIRLGEIRILREAKEAKVGAKDSPAAAPPAEVTVDAVHSAKVEADLKRLRFENDPLQTVIYVAGVSTDATAIHEYVATLCQAPLMMKVELRALESDLELRRQSSQASRFVVRIVVRPGYGQPDGPTSAPAPVKIPNAVSEPDAQAVGQLSGFTFTSDNVAHGIPATNGMRGQP